jgi:hypothetical protein
LSELKFCTSVCLRNHHVKKSQSHDAGCFSYRLLRAEKAARAREMEASSHLAAQAQQSGAPAVEAAPGQIKEDVPQEDVVVTPSDDDGTASWLDF